jgi:MazG family protein
MNDMTRLLEIMATLRDPVRGCPWDREQNFATIVPYTIEETYEVAETIERGDFAELREELGDLLFQIVFYAQLALEQGLFEFRDVVAAIEAKLIRRHPHVFRAEYVADAAAQTAAWEHHKAAERAAKAARAGRPASVLDGVSSALPATTRAMKLQQRAGRVGFDWPEASAVLDKIEEEIAELRTELLAGARKRAQEEVGDLLFSVINLARHVDIDPESALRHTNARFERRFRAVESKLAERGMAPHEATADEMDALWNTVKAGET